MNQETEKSAGITNVVLVHGAWADGSGWEDVYRLLKADGYNVSVVQNPLTSFADDVAATRRVIASQDGRRYSPAIPTAVLSSRRLEPTPKCWDSSMSRRSRPTKANPFRL